MSGSGSDMILAVSFYKFVLLKSLILDLSLTIAMRRVLHLKMVTQCAMLEDFGIFLVLADKVCWFLFHFKLFAKSVP